MRVNRPRPVFFSGIGPGESGTGRLVEWLCRTGCSVVFLREPTTGARYLLSRAHLWAAMREFAAPRFSRGFFAARLRLEATTNLNQVVLLHPQTIGMQRVVEFIRKRKIAPWLLLLDSGYFCIRSYNYIPGERAPCERCVGGQFEAIQRHGCEPFPVVDPAALSFVRDLIELVVDGRVRLLAQCASQARLARRHFGVDVPVVGLWTAGWEELFELSLTDDVEPSNADILYHGNWVDAKGAPWLVEVARHCAELRFLFPCAAPRSAEDLPPTCRFQPMSWNTGLSEAVARAGITVVPSLWSSPIEGALVKSLLRSRAVAVVANATGFASEIPADVALHLPAEPTAAAERLLQAVRQRWRPDPEARYRWLRDFKEANASMVFSIRHMSAPRTGTGRPGE